LNIGSLFAGIGGFDLAARWMGWETKWYSEIDPYACRVMEKHFGEAYNVGDITRWEPRPEDAVDIICGGFPCQPVSVAGKRQAQEDERWLWPEFARVLGVLRPRYVVIENVAGLLSRGMGDVLSDLASIGYDAEWAVLDAQSFGVPQQRKRVFIVGHTGGNLPLRMLSSTTAMVKRGNRTPAVGASLHHTLTLRRESIKHGNLPVVVAPCPNPSTCVNGQGVRATDGFSRRLDIARYRTLGNAIVPQCAYEIFKALT
jgi:DNA-cytosine methyltransferase